MDTWAGPAIATDGTIYITSNQPKAGLYAINPDGTEKWFYPVGVDMFNSASIGKDGTIYIGVHVDYNAYELIAINPDGGRVYSFHPWEKNIAKVKPYLYTDITIRGYLDKLKDRGENPDDYKSIWYYY